VEKLLRKPAATAALALINGFKSVKLYLKKKARNIF
jgi:hypothetical protein